MTDTLAVCLLSLSLFCCTSLSTARQLPKECVKGPTYWCETLKNAASCGAVGHCTTTVWEMEVTEVRSNIVSDKIVQHFSQLKDVRAMINEDYLSSSVRSWCSEAGGAASRQCVAGTADLGEYLMHVLQSGTSPQTICKIIRMCNDENLDLLLAAEASTKPTEPKPVLGASRCTWGPSYWCTNFSTGRECKATPHCVKRVWSRAQYPRDDDGICKICKDMVAQARDQLQSNQTQEELKEVFEGECALIPIKLVRKECDRLADDFVPELVETLASQMDPGAVCSVAGLCNNARIDRLIEDYNATLKLREGCVACRRSVAVARKRFDETDDQDFLVGMLKVCGNMGSLSDSCSMIVFKYFENIVAAVRKDFTPNDVCHLSGQCAHRYHSHDLYTFPDDDLNVKATDDIPCEFCEQVIKHLRDTMVANTTELEFKKILKGLCKQTGSFKSECLSLVDEYYGMVYNFLVSELNASVVCGYIGICTNHTHLTDLTIAPLLPRELEVKTIAMSHSLVGADEANSYSTHKPSKQENVQILGAENAQLPIERMFVSMPPKEDNLVCSFCQYFLHYIQVELSDDNTEEAIKKVVENACDVLPESINPTCRQFVSQYGSAVIALLVQQIDPSTVCPALGLCAKIEEVRRVSINSDKSNCPLCLFAVEQLETVLKNNKSEATIRGALSALCGHLSSKLRTQCVDFVDEYSDRLVEMLVADLNAQEICVYLKLCKDDARTDPLRIRDRLDKYHRRPHLRGDWNNRRRPMLPASLLERGVGDIETNEIPDDTVNGRPVGVQGSVCVMCEFVLKEIDDSIKDKHNDDEIKKVVHGICKRMPKSVRTECDQFVEKYADLIISLLAQELDPDEVCRELKLCKAAGFDAVKVEVLECAVCEAAVVAMKKVLANKTVDHDIAHVADAACGMLPAKYNRRCSSMLRVYGAGLLQLLQQCGARAACGRAGLCAARAAGAMLHDSE